MPFTMDESLGCELTGIINNYNVGVFDPQQLGFEAEGQGAGSTYVS